MNRGRMAIRMPRGSLDSPYTSSCRHEKELKVMRSILLSLTVFAVVLGGGLAGMILGQFLAGNLLGSDAKDIIRLATGLLVTMTALVLGMLVSSANSSYQDRKSELAEMASDFVVLDQVLGSYGSETQVIRDELRRLAEVSLERIWPSQASRQSQLRPGDNGLALYHQLQILAPKNDAQTVAKAVAISKADSLRRTYWLMFLKSEQNSLSFPLLAVLVAWLTIIFVGFGLLAPRNDTIIATLVVCALAVSGAILIIMAMYKPFSGIMTISPAPIHDALSRMGPAPAPERVLSEPSDLHRDSRQAREAS
jgi:hypothetical protein